MLGWKLFLRAVRLIVENLDAALRISALPYGLAAAASVWVATGWPELVGVTTFDPADPPPAAFVGASMLSVGLTILAYMWIAVAWHRYILLSEGGTGWVPPFHGGLVLGYLGRSILLGVAVLVLVLAVLTMAAVALLPLFGTAIEPLIGAMASVAGLILIYRMGVILPAGAVGRRMTFGEAMRLTAGHSGTVIVLALATVGFSFLFRLPMLIEGSQGLVSVIYQVVVQWIALLVGVGTLTAVYGVVIEGRPVE